MPPETDPRRWLAKAESDLRSAEATLQPGFVLTAQSMWASQQAAEKAIKAVLLHLALRFPFTHDLDALTTILPPENRPPVSSTVLAELSQSATSLRYPSDDADPEVSAAQNAYASAAAILTWARVSIAAKNE